MVEPAAVLLLSRSEFVVLRDLMGALRQALRPHARRAASVASKPAWEADPSPLP